MNIIKRHWLLLTIILVTLAVNGILGFLILHTSGQVDKDAEAMEAQIGKVKATIDFQKKKYGLTDDNKKKAQNNKDKAWESYEKDYNDLVSKYGVAKYDEKFARTPLEAQDFIQQKCDGLRQDLEAKGIKLAAGVERFTFDNIVGKAELPPKENVEFIVRNMLIVDDIVKILYQSGLQGIDTFKRGELKLKEHEGVYKYLPFTLTIKGNYGSVRKFVNQLNDADTAGHLYIIRNIDLKATDILSTLGAAATGTGDEVNAASGGKSKSERIAFKNMASITATVEFDYIEMIKKEPK